MTILINIIFELYNVCMPYTPENSKIVDSCNHVHGYNNLQYHKITNFVDSVKSQNSYESGSHLGFRKRDGYEQIRMQGGRKR